MTDDIFSHLGTVTREVAVRGTERTVVLARRYDTEPDDLWDAITNPERLPRWFLPITGDLRPGGRFQLQGNAGGEILVCDAPAHLAVTWEYGGEAGRVDVRLAADPAGGTRLELRHVATVDDDRWNQFGPGAVGVGWDLALMGLGEHLKPGSPAVAPESAMAWMGSAEGHRFMTDASEAWYRAAVAAGTDEAAARAAADRTIAAYTGEASAS